MPIRTVEQRGDVSIDGASPTPGTLTIERSYRIYEPSPDAVKADPEWTFVDPAGHFHAWAASTFGASDEKPSLPTLRTEAIPVLCDGSCGIDSECEGYTDIGYRCRICGAEVEPGMLPDDTRLPVLDSCSWSVKTIMPAGQLSERIQLWPQPTDLDTSGVSVVVTAGGEDDLRLRLFGVGRIITISTSNVRSADEDHYVDVEIAGLSPLGSRQMLLPAAAPDVV